MYGLNKDDRKYWGCSNCTKKDTCNKKTNKYKNFCYDWKRKEN